MRGPSVTVPILLGSRRENQSREAARTKKRTENRVNPPKAIHPPMAARLAPVGLLRFRASARMAITVPMSPGTRKRHESRARIEKMSRIVARTSVVESAGTGVGT
jgi:hypothetical protein